MKKRSLLLLGLITCLLVAGEVELEFDFSSPDPLTAAITRGAEQAYQVNLQGLDALEAGKLTVAEQHFRQAMSLIPLYSDAQNNLAVVYYRTNRVDSAMAIWRSITVSDEEYHLSWYNLALHAFDKKEYARATDFLKKTEKFNKRFVPAKFLRAQCYYEMGNKKKCGELLQASYAIDPKRADLVEYYAFFKYDSGDIAGAITLLDGRVEPELRILKGEILAITGKTDEAIAVLTPVKELDTTGAVSEILIDIYLDRGDVDKAFAEIKGAKRSLKNIPTSIWINAAFALSEKGKNKDAIKWLKKGHVESPDPDILYNLGQLYYRVGDYNESIRYINLLPENIRDGQSFFVLANAYWKEKSYSNAKEALYSALHYDRDARYYLLLGRILRKEGEKVSAKIQLQKALALDKSLEDAKIELALLNEGGDYSALIALMEDRLKGCKNCYSEMNRLATLYQLNGQWQKGVALIESKAHKSRELSMTLFYILEKSGDYQKAKKVLNKAERKGLLTQQDRFVFAQFLSEYRYYKESSEICTALSQERFPLKGKVLYLLGFNAMKSRDYKKAAEFLERSLKIDSESVATKSSLAYVLNELGDQEAAKKLWEKSVKGGSGTTDIINLGLLAYKKGEYRKALSYYEKAMAKKADKALAINMANCYFSLKEYNRAFELYKKGIQSSDSLEAFCGIYWSAKKLGRTADMKKSVGKIASLPLFDNSRRILANEAFGNEQYKKARSLMVAVDTLDGADYFLLSQVELRMKSFPKAKEYVQKAQALGFPESEMRAHLQELAFAMGDLEAAKKYTGNSAKDLYNKAVILYNGSEYAEYLKFFENNRAVFIGDDRITLLGMACNSASYLKQWDVLLALAKESYQLSRSASAAYNCAVALYNQKQYKEAYKYYTKARAIDATIHNQEIEKQYELLTKKAEPKKMRSSLTELDSLFNYALTLHQSGKAAQADSIYKKILDKDDQYYRAWNNRGIYQGELGNMKKAAQCYIQAIEITDTVAESFINLVYLYMATEEYESANKWLERGLKQHADNKQLHKFKEELGKIK